MRGIAGENIEVGHAVYLDKTDGKFYLATTKGHIGVASEQIKQGGSLYFDEHSGTYRPVPKAP